MFGAQTHRGAHSEKVFDAIRPAPAVLREDEAPAGLPATGPGGGPGPPAPSPYAGMFEHEPDGGHPAARRILDAIAGELARAGQREQVEAMRRTAHAMRASDGMLDSDEGAELRRLAHETGTSGMSFVASMYARGLDPVAIHRLQERLRNVDSAASVKQGVSHEDHLGRRLADPSCLSPDELRLLAEAQASRFEDAHGAYTTTSGKQLEATRYRKIVDGAQAGRLAAGEQSVVGGFVGMDGDFEGLSSCEALQMAGLDSTWHEKQGLFDRVTRRWTACAQQGIDVVEFAHDDEIAASRKLPLGHDAVRLMQREAQRRRANRKTVTRAGQEKVLQEYVPELLEAGATGPDGLPSVPRILEMNRDAADGNTNPYTGWGHGATRRAVDAAGAPLPVIANQELKLITRSALRSGSRLARLMGNGAEVPVADLGSRAA